MPTRHTPTLPLVEVLVQGALNAAAVPRIRLMLDDAVSLKPAHLVADLADCPVLDAAGIDLLVATHRSIWGAGGRLTLRGMSPRLSRLLALARVDHVLQTAPAPAGYRPRHRSSARAIDPAPTAVAEHAETEVRWWEPAGAR